MPPVAEVNGFVQNTDFPQPGRLCFAAHCAENNHTYSGGYNTYEFEFAVACRYKIIAVQLQRVRIELAACPLLWNKLVYNDLILCYL